MKPADIAIARLYAQQICSSKFINPKDIVAYMGAIQSQDYAMSKWAIGLRLAGSTEKQIDGALDKGEIIRTHVLRPTWHIVAATDIYWMLDLSAARIKALMKTTNKQLELTEQIFSKSNNIIEKCVDAGKHADRDTIAAALEKGNISLQKNRLSHLLVRAELEAIICSGKQQAGKRTYASLPQRVPKKKNYNKEEALAMLAQKYFISHGPATVEDFSWWSGLTLTDSRKGLEAVKSNYMSEKIDKQVYWFRNDLQWPAKTASSVYLLPSYDEYIISYKNRTASLAAEHHKKLLAVNGIFHPAIVVNGQVAGLWKRSVQKESLHIETEFFKPQNKAIHGLIKKQAKEFSRFSGLQFVIV